MGNLKLKSIVICNKGNVRKTNQDNFLLNGKYNNSTEEKECVQFMQSKDDIQVYGVFDGMGGMQGGEIASLISVQVAAEYRDRLIEQGSTNMNQAINEYYHEANKNVCDTLMGQGGTTAAIIWVDKELVYGSNIGDTRIYLFRDNNLRQMSCDHTEVALFKRLSTGENKYLSKLEGGLTQYLGIDANEMIIEPFYFTLVPKNDDKLLICTDGLTGFITNEDIRYTLEKELDIKLAAQELLKKVELAHGKDNITIMLLQFKKKWSIC